VVIIGGLVLVIALLTFLVIRLFSYRRKKEETPVTGIDSMFGETTVHIPEGLFFDRSHTWTFMERNGKVRTGIDDFLQHVTGKITRVIMKNPGEKVVKGETYLTLIQDGKQLEIKSPVNGIVMEKNASLLSNASLLNTDPYTEGWIYLIETPNWIKETRAYFMGNSYRVWLKEEFIRLKDFLAFAFKSEAKENVQVVLQDGGELKEGLLESFGPKEWEDFQTGFINTSK
jgi:glycine cleavage system H lipoate-binding protein